MTPPLLEAKRTEGHNLGIIHISHVAHSSYHAFTLMSTPYFVPPTGQKVGVKNKFAPSHFQNRGPYGVLSLNATVVAQRTLKSETTSDGRSKLLLCRT